MSFIKIDDTPILAVLTVLVSRSNISSFFIRSYSINNFTMLIVEEFTFLEFEKLVPLTVDSIRVYPSVSDVNGIIVVSLASDSSRLVIEVELLGWPSISGLDNKSVGNVIKISSTLHCSLDEERSVDMHSPVLAVS